MNTSQSYIAISIAVIVVTALLIFVVNKNRKRNRLTLLASLAFGFVLSGILFGADRIVGYGLLGVGVLLAVVDMIYRSKGR
jgi:hypothetical protein